MKRSIWMVPVALLLGIVLLPTSASAADDDVPPTQDNPTGCTTATAEADDGCGAQGRDHFANAGHRPPIEACATSTSPTGSTVTRIVPAGPTRADGSLAFTSGVCVYLPPGYEASGLHYPVVYLLHGGGGDQADWVSFGNVRSILDAAYAHDPTQAVIAVMPDGRSGQYYDYLNGRFLLETYLLRSVVPAVDARFRTIPDRAGRAIAGLSNGGYGALHMAAKAPDLFSVAGSMSGNLGARTFTDLGDTNAVYYQGNVPYQLAANLDQVDLIIDWGATCSSDVVIDLCATWAFEQSFRGDNMAFRTRLDDVKYAGHVDYRETEGSHAWRWWTKWLTERDLPYFFERLAKPSDAAHVPATGLPASIRYRSIAPHFSVWGYDVAVERSVREFLDLADVKLSGLAVQGSGRATITTAGRYTPGRSYRITGATAESNPTIVTADPTGRLEIVVDLGPSHPQDQFTPQSDLAEALGGYWVQRQVTITPDDTLDPLVGSFAGDADAPDAELGSPAVAPRRSFADIFVGSSPVPAAAEPERATPIAARVAEVARRVSIPLTAIFLVSMALGGGAWWRRRPTRGGAA